MEIIDVVKVMVPATVAFIVGILGTPLLTFYLYRYRVWKKQYGKVALDGAAAVEFGKLREDVETKTPRMGGIVVWGSVLITTLLLYVLGILFPGTIFEKLDFLSRSQTWIPLLTLVIGGLVGAVNDILDVTSSAGEKGIRLSWRLMIVGLLALFVGWWFYCKLDVSAIGIPFDGDLFLGVLIVPFFVLVALGLYASGVIDGIDGLSGGVFGSIFAAYSLIAFFQNQIDLAAFCATVSGGLLAFLWFNIPPARFWMTETGTMGLTITIAAIAFMTDTLGGGEGVFVLPIIGFLLVVTVLSNVLQIASKKFRGKKLLIIAPLHHHFEAIGWPGYKVTMRYWILSVMLAFVGIVIALLG